LERSFGELDIDFTYDKLDRLTGVDYFDSTDEEFTMDDLGNRDLVDLRSGGDGYVIDASNNRKL
jgi:hypothetical protein